MGAMIGGGEVGGGRSQVHYIYGIRVNGGQKQNKALARLDMLCNLLQKVKRGEKKITSKRKKENHVSTRRFCSIIRLLLLVSDN